MHKIKVKLYKNEEWRPLKCMINHKIYKTKKYYISNYGRIKNSKDKLMKLRTDKKGYSRITLTINGIKKDHKVHRLVAFTFLGNPLLISKQVNHKNGIKSDNRVVNLEWCSCKQNILHANKNLLIKRKHGIDVHNNKYSEELIINICILLEKNKSTKEIKKILGMKDIPNRYANNSLINSIRRRINWNYISKDYRW